MCAVGVLLLSLATYDTKAVSSYPLQTVEMPEQTEETSAPPARLIIPAIDVNATVQHVGLDPAGTGEMDVPSNFTDVGWYRYGVRPGMHGSAVIAGHVSGRELPEAIFYELHTLEIGDEIISMSAEGEVDRFQVVQITTYAHDDPTEEVFVSTDGKARLNLITCSGTWLPEEDRYDMRTVVFAERVTDVE